MGILGQPYCGIGATIRIGREILCLPYAGFLVLQCNQTSVMLDLKELLEDVLIYMGYKLDVYTTSLETSYYKKTPLVKKLFDNIRS